MPDDEVGERLLVVDQLGDALLDGALAHELVDEHGLALTDAPGTIGGLVLDGRVPPAVVVDHLARRREVQSGASRLERHEQQRWPETRLKLGNDSITRRLRRRAAEERHRPAESLGDMAPQERAHLDELGEHERSFVDVDQLVDQLVEAGEFSRPAVQPGAVAESVGRMVADLLELGEGGKDDRSASHPDVLVGGVEQFVDDLLVQRGLLAGESGPGNLLDLVRQLRHELAVGLRTAQYERLRQRPQRGGCLGRHGAVVASFDRLGVAVTELLARAEHARVGPVENCPQFGETVLDRCSGEGDALTAVQPAHGARRSCGRILDELRFVEDDCRPGDAGEHVDVAGEQTVRRDDEVAGGQGAGRLVAVIGGGVALGAMVHGDRHRRGEAAGLGLPVVHDREWADDEMRSGPVDEMGERRRRLTEPHVIGEASTEPEAIEKPQPTEAASLIGAQLAGERRWLDLLAQRGVG